MTHEGTNFALKWSAIVHFRFCQCNEGFSDADIFFLFPTLPTQL